MVQVLARLFVLNTFIAITFTPGNFPVANGSVCIEVRINPLFCSTIFFSVDIVLLYVLQALRLSLLHQTNISLLSTRRQCALLSRKPL